MTQQMQVDEQVACNWCGLYSRPGAMCETCGSPLVGGHILVLGDERPKPRPARRTRRREPVKPSAGSVFCAWCGLPSASGAQCEVCGSPLVGGHILFLPDEAGEAPPQAAGSTRAAGAGRAPKAAKKPRPRAQTGTAGRAGAAAKSGAPAKSGAAAKSGAPADAVTDTPADAVTEAPAAAGAAADPVAEALPKLKPAPRRRRATRGPKARPLPVRAASAPVVEEAPQRAEPEAVDEEPDGWVVPQPFGAKAVEPEATPPVEEDGEPSLATAIAPDSEVDPTAVEIVVDGGEAASEPAPADPPALEVESEAVPGPEPTDLPDPAMPGPEAESPLITETIDEPGPEGPTVGMEVARDEAPAVELPSVEAPSVEAPNAVDAPPAEPTHVERASVDAPPAEPAVEAPEQVREGRRGLSRIIRLPRTRKVNPRSTRRTTTPDAHTPPPDDGLAGTRVRRARPKSPSVPPTLAAAAKPLPPGEPPIVNEPEATLGPVAGGEAGLVEEAAPQAGFDVTEIAQDAEPETAPAAIEPEPQPEPEAAPAAIEPEPQPVVARHEPPAAAALEQETIPDTDVNFADLFDTLRETPTGSLITGTTGSSQRIQPRREPVRPATKPIEEGRTGSRDEPVSLRAPSPRTVDRRTPKRAPAPRKEIARSILPAGFDPVSDIEAWIRDSVGELTVAEPERGSAQPLPEEPEPAVVVAVPARPRQEAMARPGSRKRKRITCTRCGQASEQTLCEACREAFDALRSLSHDLAAGLE